MKNIKLLSIIILTLIVLTGCSKKPASMKDFANLMKDKNISIYDVTDIYGYAKKAYKTNSEDYQVLFVESKNLKDMQGVFLDEVKNIYGFSGIATKSSDIEDIDKDSSEIQPNVQSGKSWGRVEIETEDNYYYVSYIDKTMLLIIGNKDNADMLKEIKNAMKY